MRPLIDDSGKPWQRPNLRCWIVFVLVGALVAFSSSLLASNEAQARAKQSPDAGPVQKAAGDSANKVRDAAAGAGKAANGNEARRNGGGENAAANDPAPRADGPSTPRTDGATPVDSGTKLQADKSVLKGATDPIVGPNSEKATRPLTAPVLGRATSADAPVLGATPAVDPVLQDVTPVDAPVNVSLGNIPEANVSLRDIPEVNVSQVTAPVLDQAEPLVEPTLDVATPLVEPVLSETAPVVEPLGAALDPAATWQIPEAVSPAVEPVLKGAIPPAEPAAEGASPVTEPVTGAASPIAEPVFEKTPPVVVPDLGEGVFRAQDEVSVPAADSGAINPGFPPITLPRAPAGEATSVLPAPVPVPTTTSNAQGASYGSAGEVRLAAVGPPGSRFQPSGRPLTSGGDQASMLDTRAATDTGEATPRPFQVELPYGMLLAGGSLGGSGVGVGLDLLGILVLLPLLSWAGRLPWSLREASWLDLSLRLALERPG